MIKAEVVFDQSEIIVNGYTFSCLNVYGDGIGIYKDGNLVACFMQIEKAIAYCLESQHETL